MPFSTIGPLFSRLVYGRPSRSMRLQCVLLTVTLLPLGLLFYYALTDPSQADAGSLLEGGAAGKYKRHLERAGSKAPPPSRDVLLDTLIMSKSTRTNNPIPDTRPNDCIASSSEDSPPALEQIRERMPSIRTTIVLIPDYKHSSVSDYQLTLASILSTTDKFYEKLEIAIVINELLTNEVVKFVEKLKDSTMPRIYLVKPTKTRKTLFHELMELGDQLHGDVLVYISSGMECNVGWLEAMIAALSPKLPSTRMESTSTGEKSNAQKSQDLIRQLQPVIVTPHFDKLRTLDDGEKHYEPESEFVRLLFHWNLKPMWYEMSFEELLHRNSEAEDIAAPAFLPIAYAVNKTSPLYAKLVAHFSKREGDDTTSFEAAQYVWRCLQGAVVIAPCARVGAFNAYIQPEFDPKMTAAHENAIKKRIIETWFDHYRPIALRLVAASIGDDDKIEGKIGDHNSLPDSCTHNFLWFLENVAKEVVVPEDHIAFGSMKSGGGACFRAAIEHRLLGGPCAILSDAHVFFLEKDGSIRTRTGLCLSAPDQLSYIELVECDPKDMKQRWIYGSDGTLKAAEKDRCLMHATDPDEEKKTRQILMLYNCKDEADTEYAAFQKFTFTYKIV